MLVITDVGAAAFLLAIISGALALAVQTTWDAPHDCGNRYCRHIRRDEDDPSWRRP